MSEKKYTQKHIMLKEEQLLFLQEIVDTDPKIKSISEANRYAIDLAKELQEKEEWLRVFQKKQNAMSKEISILVQMVAGSSEVLGVEDINEAKDTTIYKSAKNKVNEEIQKIVTKKYTRKNSDKDSKDLLEKNNNTEVSIKKNIEKPILSKSGGFNWQNQV